MKFQKLLSIILTVLICLTNIPISTITAEESETIDIWDGSTDTSWYDSEETELYISTPEELAGLAELVNSGKTMEGQTISLKNDIYLNDISNFENWEAEAPLNSWISIGCNEAYFSGIFNGNQFCVYGAYISIYSPGQKLCDQIGFFAKLYGEIHNLALDNTYFSITTGGDGRYCNKSVGGITGYLENGLISNCSFNGKIIYTYGDLAISSASSLVGGICGNNYMSTINQCINKAEITVYGCNTYHSVGKSYRGDVRAGGICGRTSVTEITNSKNAGKVTGAQSPTCIGGIVALAYDTNVINCYNSGIINATGSVGGIICELELTSALDEIFIKNVYNVGPIETGSNIGGIIANVNFYYYDGNIADLNIENSYYLSDTATKGIVNIESNYIDINCSDTSIAKNSENMRTKDFAKALGKAFVYVEGEYPKLLWEMDYVVANFVEENIILTEYDQQKSPELVTNYLESPTWVSSDTSVATVENGTITAKNNGECIIYAVCGDIRAECNVTVDYGYTLNNTSIEINEDETVQLAVISDNTGLTAEGFEIEWTSSDESVVTVKNGTVTAVNDGMATITASFGNTSLECEVVVNALIPDPELNITSLELYEGETEELAVNNYTGNITWISDDTEVVKVENGIVKAIAPGNANIYAMLSNGTNFICSVTVNKAKVTSVITTNVTITETTTVTTIATTVTEETAKPDLNGDGKTNVTDVLILQKFLVKIPSDDNIKIIDINNDKKINVFDLIILKRFILYN